MIMKNLLFTLFLIFFLYSCQTTFDSENSVGDFSSYYEQFQEKEIDHELLSQAEQDSLQIVSKEIVNN